MSSSEPLIILALAAAAPPQSPDTAATPASQFLVLDPLSDSLFLIGGLLDTDLPINNAASEAAIRALPTIRIEEEGIECAICLEEFEVGGEVKEMTCKHRFHSGCAEKWLRVNGSCPVCRFRMPVEEESEKNSKVEEEGDRVGGVS